MTRKTITAALAACLLGLLVAASAYAERKPSSGTSVGLDHEPEGIVARGVTDDKGNVTFAGTKGSTWLVGILAFKTKDPVIVTITAGGKTQVSAPLSPGKGDGPVFAVDQNGRKLMVEVPDGGKIVVNVQSAN